MSCAFLVHSPLAYRTMTSMQLLTVLMVAATTTAVGGYSIQNIFLAISPGVSVASSPEMKLKTHITSIALGVLFSVFLTPLAAHAQDKIVRVQTLQDAWQVRRAETRAFITAIGSENVTQAQHASALSGFDSRLTAAEKGELTPIETMEMFQVFYIPKELQKRPARFDMLLRIVAAQATIGWYDALRFADDSGRSEISNNEAFFTLAFDKSTPDFFQFMKEQPDQAAAAVKAGIQDARDRIAAKQISYDPTWPASYGMSRTLCAMNSAKTCEGPTPRPAGEWPALLDQAAQRVSTFYRAAKAGQ